MDDFNKAVFRKFLENVGIILAILIGIGLISFILVSAWDWVLANHPEWQLYIVGGLALILFVVMIGVMAWLEAYKEVRAERRKATKEQIGG